MLTHRYAAGFFWNPDKRFKMDNTKFEARSPYSEPATPLLTVDLPGIKKVKSGKVREMFDLDDCFLMVATDRISAFDCIMPNGIPRKGEVLTQLSHFWFDQMNAIVENHRHARAEDPLPPRHARGDDSPRWRSSDRT